MHKKHIQLIYDKECPVCRWYCHIIRIRQSLGNLEIINAREDSELINNISRQGFDLNQGMLLKIDNNFYTDAEAIHILALMSTRSDIFNRMNYWLFKSKTFSRYSYPVLRFCRLLLLKILGKTKITQANLSK